MFINIFPSQPPESHWLQHKLPLIEGVVFGTRETLTPGSLLIGHRIGYLR